VPLNGIVLTIRKMSRCRTDVVWSKC